MTHKVIAQRLPAHSLHAAHMVVAQHLRCTRARQQWGLPWVPLVGSRALTRWWHGCLHRCEGLNRAGGCGYLSASKKVRTPSWFNNELKMTRCEGHECVQVSFVVLLAPGIEAGNGDGGKEGSTATGTLHTSLRRVKYHSSLLCIILGSFFFPGMDENLEMVREPGHQQDRKSVV